MFNDQDDRKATSPLLCRRFPEASGYFGFQTPRLQMIICCAAALILKLPSRTIPILPSQWVPQGTLSDGGPMGLAGASAIARL